jgi:hypothetical protein
MQEGARRLPAFQREPGATECITTGPSLPGFALRLSKAAPVMKMMIEIGGADIVGEDVFIKQMCS